MIYILCEALVQKCLWQLMPPPIISLCMQSLKIIMALDFAIMQAMLIIQVYIIMCILLIYMQMYIGIICSILKSSINETA